MRILLLGGGGREHAIAWKLAQDPGCDGLYIAPGNAGTDACGENVPLQVNDFEGIRQFCIEKQIDLLLVGPEEPLVRGVSDFFRKDPSLQHITVIGPSAEGAQLEGSKAFAKKFMQRHGIPTAAYREVTSVAEGMDFLRSLEAPYVLKADGLAAGKGVVILDDLDEAEAELKAMLDGKFGEAGRKVVIEAFLSGIEFSVFVVTDGRTYKLLPEAKDYKRIGEGDTGLNTGGMGAVSPVPFFDAAMRQKVVERIIEPTVKGIASEGIDYTGFIFFGLISVQGEPYVIEYNCRMGDPETEVVMPRLETHLTDIFRHIAAGTLDQAEVETKNETAAAVMLVAGGYPGDYRKGDAMHIVENGQSLYFHAGTKKSGDAVVTNGGRVLAITSFGTSIEEAVGISVAAAGQVQFDGRYFRGDIGRDLTIL